MTELTFTKSFLSTLDSRPIKLPADYIIDPKTLTLEHAYTLPKMPPPHPPMRKPSPSTSTAGTSTSPSDPNAIPTTLTVTLKSSRNPPLELKVEDVDVNLTSVLSLKERVARELGLEGTGKVKVLWERKPVGDAKSVKEVLGEEGLRGRGTGVEFGVMVMGWSAKDAVKKGEKTGWALLVLLVRGRKWMWMSLRRRRMGV
ncbi:uncharacterized protein KY384_000176 [Bacidia gigantensis]|uniref:uncharacterized protein n=1 Tax=Bacidia gigantensis TaxID=2732470 RepID=UPI001D05A371|nr:uncharacterized protein KY384_000176 [Bacidia gigantensis]KAG8526183.1 hypothetical protein KY384_000176 [Bacidia gigantensis]